MMSTHPAMPIISDMELGRMKMKANDDIISMVETTPTYKRTKMELENIRSKATTEEKIAPEPETTTNTGSMTITF